MKATCKIASHRVDRYTHLPHFSLFAVTGERALGFSKRNDIRVAEAECTQVCRLESAPVCKLYALILGGKKSSQKNKYPSSAAIHVFKEYSDLLPLNRPSAVIQCLFELLIILQLKC